MIECVFYNYGGPRCIEDRIIVNKTRPIKSVDTNVSLNKMLWGLTEEWL